MFLRTRSLARRGNDTVTAGPHVTVIEILMPTSITLLGTIGAVKFHTHIPYLLVPDSAPSPHFALRAPPAPAYLRAVPLPLPIPLTGKGGWIFPASIAIPVKPKTAPVSQTGFAETSGDNHSPLTHMAASSFPGRMPLCTLLQLVCFRVPKIIALAGNPD